MKRFSYFLALLSIAIPAASFAEPVVGMAHPWQLNFQAPHSPVMEKLYDLHSVLLVIITAVSLLVLALTLYIIVRFNRKANPVPSKTAHNTMIEIVWTVIPIIILVGIAIPSVRNHYFMERVPEAAMTLKVTGNQWYWSYQYPDQGGFGFDSYMLSDADAKAKGEPRLLGVDNRVVIPVNTNIRVQLTASDVIHAWAIPAFGVKRDAVPGRLNETWFSANKEGIFYGQCSELCGKGHGFMPIAVEVVSQEKFDAWVAEKQKAAGITPAAPAEKTETKPAV
jgi:cytochrome c oxidase subunit II